MENNDKKINIDDLKKLKDELLETYNLDEEKSDTVNGKIKILSDGHFKETKEEYIDKKAGMVNVLLLSIITFVCETLFLFISFNIFG